nr:hypothetical protein [Tanacetum cinerariifolium]
VDGAQSYRVPVPLTKDPYEAIRQAYLVGTDTESEPFGDLVEAETPESPHMVASPTLLLDSTPPACRVEETACMAMRVSLTMSPGLSASIVEVEAMTDLAFRKSEGDELGEKEDEEGEGLAARDGGPDMRVESLGLGRDKTIHEGQQWAALVMEIAVGEPLGLSYGALRCWEIASREGQMPSVFEVGQGSRYMPEPERPERVSALRHHYLLSGLASPATDDTEGFLTELGAKVEMQGGLIRDHMVRLRELSPDLFKRYDRDIKELFTRLRAVWDEIFSQRYRFRSLEHEQARTAMTFGALWRLMLALEAWAGCVDTQISDMSWAEYDDHSLVHDMLLQQVALQRELREMRGRVTALEQERDRKER